MRQPTSRSDSNVLDAKAGEAAVTVVWCQGGPFASVRMGPWVAYLSIHCSPATSCLLLTLPCGSHIISAHRLSRRCIPRGPLHSMAGRVALDPHRGASARQSQMGCVCQYSLHSPLSTLHPLGILAAASFDWHAHQYSTGACARGLNHREIAKRRPAGPSALCPLPSVLSLSLTMTPTCLRCTRTCRRRRAHHYTTGRRRITSGASGSGQAGGQASG